MPHLWFPPCGEWYLKWILGKAFWRKTLSIQCPITSNYWAKTILRLWVWKLLKSFLKLERNLCGFSCLNSTLESNGTSQKQTNWGRVWLLKLKWRLIKKRTRESLTTQMWWSTYKTPSTLQTVFYTVSIVSSMILWFYDLHKLLCELFLWWAHLSVST